MDSEPINSVITKEFLQKLLGQELVSFKIDIGSKPGDNVAGEIFALSVSLVDKNLNLVYKTLPSGNMGLRQFAITYSIFKTEIAMYRQIVPILEKIALKSNISLPFAKFFGGNFEGENQWLALEDLRHFSPPFKMVNKYEGLNFNEAVAAFEEIGKFHALTYYLLKYHGESFLKENEMLEIYSVPWKNRQKDPLMKLVMNGRFNGAFNLAVEKVGEVDEALAQKLKAAFNPTLISEYLNRVSSLTDTKYFPVILHGDFWSNNFLFQTHPDGSLSMKFVDFQLSRRGNIFEELHYFILTSLTPALREAHLVKLLEFYFSSFMGTLAKINFPPPHNFTKGVLIDGVEELYNISSLLVMAHAIPLQLGITSADKEEENEKKVEKVNGKVEDKSKEFGGPPSLEIIIENMVEEFRRGWESNPATTQRMVSILREFEEKGVI